MSTILDKINEEMKALTPGELQQLRASVDSMIGERAEPLMSEDEFEHYLAAKGVIAPVPSSAGEDADDEDWEPVTVTGQPLSEMVIEERR
ncbi:MAG: hypothetical protein M3R15_34055 [Acidobacteriota bacterium]|nr:hypothetical protein [Acidobacteriota bacterium]